MDTPAQIEVIEWPNRPGFPAQVAKIFEAISNEITYLHGNWLVYQELFFSPGSADARKTTPQGFGMIGYTLRHEIIMGFSRLTDPKKSGKFENLTLRQLLHVIGENCEDQVWACDLKGVVTQIEQDCLPFKDVRNRAIAHLDLQTMLRDPSKPLPGIDKTLVEKCMASLRAFMNNVLGHYMGYVRDFVPQISPPTRNIIHDINEYRRWLPEIHEIERKRILGEDES